MGNYLAYLTFDVVCVMFVSIIDRVTSVPDGTGFRVSMITVRVSRVSAGVSLRVYCRLSTMSAT